MTEREDIDNSESLPLLQMDVGADSEHISAEGSSGNMCVGPLKFIVFLSL